MSKGILPPINDRYFLFGVLNAVLALGQRLTGERMVVRIWDELGEAYLFRMGEDSVMWKSAAEGATADCQESVATPSQSLHERRATQQKGARRARRSASREGARAPSGRQAVRRRTR